MYLMHDWVYAMRRASMYEMHALRQARRVLWFGEAGISRLRARRVAWLIRASGKPGSLPARLNGPQQHLLQVATVLKGMRRVLPNLFSMLDTERKRSLKRRSGKQQEDRLKIISHFLDRKSIAFLNM